MKSHRPIATAREGRQSRGIQTPIGEFVRIKRMSAMAPHEEWMATLPDNTEIVIPDEAGGPDALSVAKAIAVVQSRAYLGKRAVLLIAPFLRLEGAWRLLTIDFGAEARRYESEFLMCFAFVAANARLSGSSPYFEIGFSQSESLPEPLFSLTVKAIVGISCPF